jgi:polar amino acid transport system substrate-binding protein
MAILKRCLVVVAAVLCVGVVSACSSGSSKGDGSSASTATGADVSTSADVPGAYGKCEVYGKAGSVSLRPVQSGELTVQTNLPSPGWWKGTSPESIDGGYEYCLAANIAHRAGLKRVKVDNVSFDALVAGQTKNYDLAMAQISVTPARAKVVTFSKPYFDSNLGVLAKAGGDVSQDNLAQKKVGVQVGTTAVGFTTDQLKPREAPRAFQDQTAMVTSVTAGQTDAALQDTAIMLGFAKNSNGALKVVGQYKTGEQYAAIYPKTSPNSDVLNATITAMGKDGTLDKLSAKWLGPELGGDPTKVPVWTVK